MKTVPVTTRVTSEQLAKAREGLLAKGVSPEELLTRSQILRLSVFLAITMNKNPEERPSKESLAITE